MGRSLLLFSSRIISPPLPGGWDQASPWVVLESSCESLIPKTVTLALSKCRTSWILLQRVNKGLLFLGDLKKEVFVFCLSFLAVLGLCCSMWTFL